MAMVYEHVREAGPLVFVAGQTPQAASGDVPDGIEDQVNVVVEKIDALLAARGLGLGDVVKTTYYLTNLADLSGARAALDRLLPHPRPAATLVEVSGLVDPRFRIEIDAIALHA